VAVAKQGANPHEDTVVADVAVENAEHAHEAAKQPIVVVGDDGYLELLDRAHAAGHVTDQERRERRLVHLKIRSAGAVA
jgi:hypothetical protein